MSNSKKETWLAALTSAGVIKGPILTGNQLIVCPEGELALRISLVGGQTVVISNDEEYYRQDMGASSSATISGDCISWQETYGEMKRQRMPFARPIQVKNKVIKDAPLKAVTRQFTALIEDIQWFSFEQLLYPTPKVEVGTNDEVGTIDEVLQEIEASSPELPAWQDQPAWLPQ